ncbi:helix-turn-helix transcriptional regulator [Blastococcus sp. CT_GayMR16]|uniref:helix-turn-helix transcriptional regulator n=1 Tax=Blastococcus sp. CT_GayMR16 TaxID=2559607 RepID=UPI001ADD8AAB|nr:helix-turn-helix transcriptional regulator [Blastococcus sp. CT_GayMR16]
MVDLRERAERICASRLDARTLRLRLLAELGRAVPFDAYAWVLTDPATSVGSAPLADVPALAELPRLIRLRYLTPLNRWTTLVDPPVALLSEATGGNLSRSLVWRELLRRHDVSDVASVVFRDAHGCWAFLELWRTGGRTFGDADVAVLRAVVPAVTTALRQAQGRTFAAAAGRDRLPSGPLVLLLSPDLEVVRQTPGTREQLRLLVPRDDGGPPVPAGAYNVAAQLLATEAGVDGSPPLARVHLAEGQWMTLRAARMDDDPQRIERDIAVTIEASTPAERVDLFGRCCGLSDREQELLGHLAAGSDTREIAARMYLSAYTVQDHLKSVFTKTGTRSRPSVLARALGS